MHRPNPNTRRCTERHGQKANYARGLIRLTVAHLCHCIPLCINPTHVKAMCQRCHLRTDRWLHADHRTAKLPRPFRWHPHRFTAERTRIAQERSAPPR